MKLKKEELLMDRFLRDGKSIKGVWGDFMKKSNLNRKLIEQELNVRWEELSGSLVARHTTKLNYFEGKLTIYLDSAPLKQEVNMRKSALIKRLNDGLKSPIIEEVVIR